MISTTFQLSLCQEKLPKICKDWQLQYVETTESTNSDVKRLPSTVIETPFVLIADAQTAGRGQFERVWSANPNQNIICSIAFKPKRNSGIQLLGLLTAVSISEAIHSEYSTLKPKIKWPNDVLLNDKKTAGILVETQFKGADLEKIVIGFGVNINQTQFESDLNKTATSLALETNQTYQREPILAQILGNLCEYIHLWEKQDDAILHSIHNKLIGYEWYVSIKNLQQKVIHEKVWLLGLDHKGRLGVLTNENKEIWFEHEQIRVEPHFI